jgi:hypothetical protein
MLYLTTASYVDSFSDAKPKRLSTMPVPDPFPSPFRSPQSLVSPAACALPGSVFDDARPALLTL